MSPRRAKVLGGEASPGALRRHLIAVTQHLLAAHDAASLTTRQIAREAQVSDGVLYNHFADKDELVLTAMGQRADELVATFLAAVPEPGGGTLAAGVATLARAAFDLQAGLLPLVSGLLGRPDLIHDLFTAIHADAGPQVAFAATVAYLQGEQAAGRAAADVDAVAATELLFGACQLRALMTVARPTGTQVALGPDLDDVVAVLVRAVGP
jgi:AcrR family transcriptional regulator